MTLKTGQKGLQIAEERRGMKGQVEWISSAPEGLKHKNSTATPSFFVQPTKNQQVKSLQISGFVQ